MMNENEINYSFQHTAKGHLFLFRWESHWRVIRVEENCKILPQKSSCEHTLSWKGDISPCRGARTVPEDVWEPPPLLQPCLHASTHWYLGLSYETYHLSFIVPDGLGSSRQSTVATVLNPAPILHLFSHENELKRTTGSLFHDVKTQPRV